ncbi:hypothetical protein DUD82_08820 [Bacillus toyonensis]
MIKDQRLFALLYRFLAVFTHDILICKLWENLLSLIIGCRIDIMDIEHISFTYAYTRAGGIKWSKQN